MKVYRVNLSGSIDINANSKEEALEKMYNFGFDLTDYIAPTEVEVIYDPSCLRPVGETGIPVFKKG